jgi:peroxiredoxin
MKTRKFYCLLALSAISLAGFSQKKSSGFILKGDVEGLNNAKGYIYLYGAIKNGKQVSDSLPVNNGHFVFKGRTDEPARVSVWFQSKYKEKANAVQEFFLDNSNMTLTGVADTASFYLKEAKIVGSKLQDEYDKIFADAEKISGLKKLYEEYRTAWKSKDSLKIGTLKPKVELGQASYGKYVDSYVKTHPNSIAALYTLSKKIDPKNEAVLDELNKNIASFAPNVKSSFIAKELLKTVAFYKRGLIVGKKVTDFTQIDKDGKVVKLSDYRGKYLLLDFWASWCHPCRGENPNVLKAYNKFHPQGLEIVAVSLDEKRDAWLKAIAEDNLPWTQISDLKQRNEVAYQFGVNSIPDNFLIDPNGVVIARGLRGEELEKKLGEIFK